MEKNWHEREAELAGARFIVAGPHWSWGWHYATQDEARAALSSSARPAYSYSQCPNCGNWRAGLLVEPCAGCAA